jgi:sensor histidine kinase YesM
VLIKVGQFCESDSVIFSVSNPFDPDFVSTSKGTGFGLKSLQRRLFLVYGIDGLLKTDQSENLFTVTIKIPFS